MSTAAQIDFQLYMGLLAAELPRFSVPGIGSFTWHVERAHVDPKSGTVTPPHPALKYEPGHKYLAETIAFLRDYFSLSEKEAEALLREVGRLTAAYLRAAPEMDLWRLGKLKRMGGLYKVELHEEAPIPFVMDLAEISLRAGASPVVTLAQSPTALSEAPKKHIETSPRAQPIETPSPTVPPQPRSSRRWLPIVLGTVAVIVVMGAITYVITRKRTPPQPVEINLSTKSASTPAPKAEPPKSSKEASTAKPTPAETSPAQTPSTAKPSAPQAPIASPKPSSPPEVAPKSPSKEVKTSSQPRYYVIVGAYPSRSEAEAKATAFPGYTVEYLPHPSKAGWFRVSIFSSTNRQQAEAFLRKIKSEVPDAWVYAAP
ncbi:MAG: hypothetical protein KatS3mg025_0877 [Bacteroidia bacterium]|jgi:cell division protein FtsN|nr:MAG: hypothetical protein KatS3mg025_0877 [Bacteroidia bacterium]